MKLSRKERKEMAAEVAARTLAKVDSSIRVEFPQLEESLDEVMDTGCFMVLSKIAAVILDRTHTDPERYQEIEEIIRILDEAGFFAGTERDGE